MRNYRPATKSTRVLSKLPLLIAQDSDQKQAALQDDFPLYVNEITFIFNFKMGRDRLFHGRLTDRMEHNHRSILNRTTIQLRVAISRVPEFAQAIDIVQ
jgi:hypothetical protein